MANEGGYEEAFDESEQRHINEVAQQNGERETMQMQVAARHWVVACAESLMRRVGAQRMRSTGGRSCWRTR